jgi:hypothetical protein
MRRTLSVAAIILTALMSYGLYNMKYEVRRQESRLADLRQTLTSERQAIKVLHAEWAYLNRPARLQDLSGRHLDLQPIQVGQLTDLHELPVRSDVSSQKSAQKSAMLLGGKTQ